MSDDKDEKADEERDRSPLDDYKYHVDTGGAIICSNDGYELLDALRDIGYL